MKDLYWGGERTLEAPVARELGIGGLDFACLLRHKFSWLNVNLKKGWILECFQM
jgi:hypothetical protein